MLRCKYVACDAMHCLLCPFCLQKPWIATYCAAALTELRGCNYIELTGGSRARPFNWICLCQCQILEHSVNRRCRVLILLTDAPEIQVLRALKIPCCRGLSLTALPREGCIIMHRSNHSQGTVRG
jgi:hypothetical protein